MVAISREALNHDDGGGSRVDPVVWDHASKPKVRRIESKLVEDLAVMPRPFGSLYRNLASGGVWASHRWGYWQLSLLGWHFG